MRKTSLVWVRRCQTLQLDNGPRPWLRELLYTTLPLSLPTFSLADDEGDRVCDAGARALGRDQRQLDVFDAIVVRVHLLQLVRHQLHARFHTTPPNQRRYMLVSLVCTAVVKTFLLFFLFFYKTCFIFLILQTFICAQIIIVNHVKY